MPIQHKNRQAKTYYLHQGTTKTGKPKYFFSLKSEGTLVDIIPDGFEIYENPNARVFLRKIPPQIISTDEIRIVKQGMEQFSSVKYYQIDVKKNVIIVYTVDQDVDIIAEVFAQVPRAKEEGVENLLTQYTTYSPMLQFVLIDQEKRIFVAQRHGSLWGSIDDWIEIGKPDSLRNLVKKYVQHLEQDSYYGLY